MVVIAIDRPSKRNALATVMHATIADTLLTADDDGRVGVLIAGTDSVFTVGNE